MHSRWIALYEAIEYANFWIVKLAFFDNNLCFPWQMLSIFLDLEREKFSENHRFEMLPWKWHVFAIAYTDGNDQDWIFPRLIGYVFINGEVIGRDCGNAKITLDVRLRQKLYHLFVEYQPAMTDLMSLILESSHKISVNRSCPMALPCTFPIEKHRDRQRISFVCQEKRGTLWDIPLKPLPNDSVFRIHLLAPRQRSSE
jgi:hypothetical protein